MFTKGAPGGHIWIRCQANSTNGLLWQDFLCIDPKVVSTTYQNFNSHAIYGNIRCRMRRWKFLPSALHKHIFCRSGTVTLDVLCVCLSYHVQYDQIDWCKDIIDSNNYNSHETSLSLERTTFMSEITKTSNAQWYSLGLLDRYYVVPSYYNRGVFLHTHD